jgi:hypothetical protein
MIFGAHVIVFTHDAEADRAFFRDVLDMASVDLVAEMQRLESKGVAFSQVDEERWGTVTRFTLPGGTTVGLYQPKHPTALRRA